MPDTTSPPAPAPSSPGSMLTFAFVAWLLLSILPYILDAASDVGFDTTYWVSVCGALAVGYSLTWAVERKKIALPEDGKDAPRKEVNSAEKTRRRDAAVQTESKHQTATSPSASSRNEGSGGKGGRRDAVAQTAAAAAHQHERGSDGEARKTPAKPTKRAVKPTFAVKQIGESNKRQRLSGSFKTYTEVRFLGKILQVSMTSVSGCLQEALLQQWTKRQIRRSAARSSSRLLRLPPELRNQIWRLVLLCPQLLLVTTQAGPLIEPGLLRTSKALRDEAIRIFYLENTFLMPVDDSKGSILTRWLRSSSYRAKPTTMIELATSTNWANLKQWLKDTFEGKTVGPIQHPLPYSASNWGCHFPALLFKVLAREKEKGRSWKEVEALLE